MIFRENQRKYQAFLQKQPGEESSPDPLPSQTKWALLADKGYAGAEAFVRAIIPSKSPPRGFLTPTAITRNTQISAARVVCENFYGRMKNLFKICSATFRGTLLIRRGFILRIVFRCLCCAYQFSHPKPPTTPNRQRPASSLASNVHTTRAEQARTNQAETSEQRST